MKADIAHRGASFMLQAYICSYNEAVIDVLSQHIEMEKRGHKMSNGMSWNECWLNTIGCATDPRFSKLKLPKTAKMQLSLMTFTS
ncbi:hypothetical protein [Paenibacillus thiaminolyticus]|uniref:hypothetical protein n=1 Tax=Paenibacillus thiaminolyticus TaxID=49283 RepID=UPI002543B575|nr:hypothetical protein [Paenibacillus thiaminolyticus]WII37884.1 hypothetical protein O0V01_01670 [Paenibacillus thiaminolyticus]